MTQESGISLRAGNLQLALRPDLGGCVAGLWHGGALVLRSVPAGTLAGVRQGGGYPLLPYSNRLGHARFSFEGHHYTTEANFGDSPHSVHGVGWQRPWSAQVHTGHQAALRLVHEPDAHWPFAFEATQQFDLDPATLRVRLGITNTDARAQPVGLGWHPYFPKRAGSHLRAEVDARWDVGADELPVRRAHQSGIDNDVAALDFDHCFEGWRGVAHIDDGVFRLRLNADLTRLVVYTPPDRGYFCVEPVTHVNDAIHMDTPESHGLVILQPGERHEIAIGLEVCVA